MDDYLIIPLLVMLVLALVMMFAQVRLFSIDRTLKEIQAALTAKNQSKKATSAPLNPLSIK